MEHPDDVAVLREGLKYCTQTLAKQKAFENLLGTHVDYMVCVLLIGSELAGHLRWRRYVEICIVVFDGMKSYISDKQNICCFENLRIEWSAVVCQTEFS